MARDPKEVNRLFVKSVQSIAVDLEKAPADVTKTEFFTRNKESVSEWEIRKNGGFDALKKLNFAPDDNVEVKYGSRLVRSHVNKLSRDFGQSAFYEKELARSVREILAANPLTVHPPVKAPKRAARNRRTIVAALSDTHYGCNISKREMHGLNEFNWTIAARRTALFMEQIVEFKGQHRSETDLCLQLNGDIIAGLIHNQEWFCDLLTRQFAGSLHLLSQAVSYVAQHFSKVHVVCTPGNHGRNVAKHDKGRATTHKWDSFETMLYISLREVLAQKHRNVTFEIPESPFVIYGVQGHQVMQSHGDTVVKVGNPGKKVNTGLLNDQVNIVNTSELTAKKISMLCVGHVHVPTVQTLQSGCGLVVNGCLSGTDPFAQSIGIFASNPTQILVETTERYPIGDVRMIQLRGADLESRYDSIIRPFNQLF